MSTEKIFKNRDRFIQLSAAIKHARNQRGMTQEELAEKAQVSRSYVSAIEAPNMVRPFSLDIYFSICDALEIEPSELLKLAEYSDVIFNNKKK